jgi:hypothetical protein
VYYWTPTLEFPKERKLIGRWLGVAENRTDEFPYIIQTDNGHVVVRKSIWGLTKEELRDPVIMKRVQTCDRSLALALRNK